MLLMLTIMLLALVLAAAVGVYVAYPHRGEDVPGVPWVGEAMRKGVDALPTVDNQRGRAAEQAGQHR